MKKINSSLRVGLRPNIYISGGNYRQISGLSKNKPIIQSIFSINASDNTHKLETKKFANTISPFERILHNQFFMLNTLPIEKCLIPFADQIKQMRVLDIRSGTGSIARAILKHMEPKEIYLYESNEKIKISALENYPNLNYINQSFLYSQLKPTNDKTAIISYIPHDMIDNAQSFIEKQQIRDAILIIPADKLRSFPEDYEVISSMTNDDFYPLTTASNVHLIIKKGFKGEEKFLANNFIDVGQEKLPVKEVISYVVKLYNLSDAIFKQATDILGGNKFDSIQQIVETLISRENSQKGAEFKRNIELLPNQLELFFNKNKNQLPLDELKGLEKAITENKFNSLSLLILSHVIKHNRIVLGERYIMDPYLKSGLVKNEELLNIPSSVWNWRLNEFFISSAALLDKKVAIYCDQVEDIKNLIDQKSNILDANITSHIPTLWHAEFKRPTILAREINLLSKLNYRFEICDNPISSRKHIEAIPANQ